MAIIAAVVYHDNRESTYNTVYVATAGEMQMLSQRLARAGAEFPSMIPAGIRLSGGLSKMPGIAGLASRHFGGARTLASGPAGFRYADATIEKVANDPSWSTALGLLRVLEIQKRGQVMAKQGGNFFELFADDVDAIFSNILRT